MASWSLDTGGGDKDGGLYPQADGGVKRRANLLWGNNTNHQAKQTIYETHDGYRKPLFYNLPH